MFKNLYQLIFGNGITSAGGATAMSGGIPFIIDGIMQGDKNKLSWGLGLLVCSIFLFFAKDPGNSTTTSTTVIAPATGNSTTTSNTTSNAPPAPEKPVIPPLDARYEPARVTPPANPTL